jgi:hypothetical protein
VNQEQNKFLIFLVTLVISIAMLGVIIAGMDSVALSGDTQASTWFSLVNLNHNAFHSWRLEPISKICTLIWPGFNFAERPIPGILTLLVGTLLFFRASDGQRFTWSVIFSLGAPITILFLLITTGLDPVVIGAIACLPLLTVIASKVIAASKPRLILLALLLAASVENALSANQAALVSAASALWIAYLLTKSRARAAINLSLTSIVILTPAIFVTITAPIAEAPKYPASAHVIQYDGSQGNIRPLIGQAYQFEAIDRTAMRDEYGGRALTLLSISIFSWWTRRRHQTPVARYTAKVAMVMALLATLNSALPESVALISPLPSLSRLIPWGTTYSITSVALGLSAWMTGVTLILNNRLISFIPLAIGPAIMLAFCSPNIIHPSIRKSGLISDPIYRELVLSPSANIFRNLIESGENIPSWIEGVKTASKLKARDSAELGASIEISPAPSTEVIEAAKKSETNWRWSTRTGMQRGDELLTIRFEAATVVNGVELDPGQYFTDYPRGLRITGGSCDQNTAEEIVDYPIWQGSLRVTYRGLPYYTPRNQVKVIFSSPRTVQCIFVRQTGKAPFDWSISRVRVM